MHCTYSLYIPTSLRSAQSGLGLQMYCVGSWKLASALFVTVLNTQFWFELFHYLFPLLLHYTNCEDKMKYAMHYIHS